MPVPAFWMLSPNFGDALTPWLILKLSNDLPVYVDIRARLRKFLVTGSILNWADDMCTVWGVGLANVNDNVNPEARIRAVRGPVTRDIALQFGADCPDTYGDPALLLPKFYTRKTGPKYALGIVAHFKEQAYTSYVAYSNYLQHGILPINVLSPVEAFIDAICSCQCIMSSALHGIIAANAYRIPVLWVTFGGEIGGDGMKFYDHFMTVGGAQRYVPPTPIQHLPAAEVLKLAKEAWLPQAMPDLDKLMAACPLRGEP